MAPLPLTISSLSTTSGSNSSHWYNEGPRKAMGIFLLVCLGLLVVAGIVGLVAGCREERRKKKLIQREGVVRLRPLKLGRGRGMSGSGGRGADEVEGPPPYERHLRTPERAHLGSGQGQDKRGEGEEGEERDMGCVTLAPCYRWNVWGLQGNGPAR